MSNSDTNNKINAPSNITSITLPQMGNGPANPSNGTNGVHRSHSVLVVDKNKSFLRNFMKEETIEFITKALAEFIGTGLLLFLGCMGCVTGITDNISPLNGPLGFGFVVCLIIQIFGCVSGAHLNPSVTVASYIYNQMSLPLAATYIFAQASGAFIGFGLLKLLTPPEYAMTSDGAGMCTTKLATLVTPAQGVIIEVMITGALVLVNCGVWDPRNSAHTDSIPIRFGITIAGLSIVAGPYTGASMNSVRSLAPAVWNGYFEHHWIYWVGPLSGSVITAFMYKIVFRREVCTPPPKPLEEYPLTRDKFASP